MTTTNTAAESLSDEQILEHFEMPGLNLEATLDAHDIGLLLTGIRTLLATTAQAGAAIAAGGAQEPIYQVMVGDKWVDSTAAEYAAVSNEKRIVYAAPLPREAATVASPVDSLVSFHAEQLEGNPYCYFELAYTRQTGWMAWITDRPAQGEPGTAAYAKSRKVIVRGQGETAQEACADALSLIAAAPNGERGS